MGLGAVSDSFKAKSLASLSEMRLRGQGLAPTL
jgi:hypothetical protein